MSFAVVRIVCGSGSISTRALTVECDHVGVSAHSRRAVICTDGGLETDLIFNRDFELEEFAAFPLIYDEQGCTALADYYAGYADIARRAGVGLVLGAPTWRANRDWAGRVGYDAGATDRANQDAIAFMKRLREGWADLPEVVVSGVIGPRGDGYVAGERPQLGAAADYHRGQIESFAESGADLVEALTMTTPQEAAGIVSAAYFGVNCAHPTHVARGLTDADWVPRIVELRPNASTMTHEELDAMTELDAADISFLVSSQEALRAKLPGLLVVGGCCGTDARHVAGLWG